MNIIDIINKKRLKGELTKDEINFFIDNLMNNNIMDYQVSSLLMAILLNGMSMEETINLTDAMIKSGEVIDLSFVKNPTIDKHSTGGVGDKVTLVLAPLLASLGFSVAKMSGRGLGHTGGTIDKLEAISGYQVEISKDDFINQVNNIGIAVISQTGNLAPADKKLYALRDVTGTVESIPLIAASIMSKKIASGSEFIILDVKVGNGALMKNLDDAKRLALTMKKIGEVYGKKVVCVLSNMEEPLGHAVGNSIEVNEAIDTLKGNGPKDLTDLVINMAAISLMNLENISYLDAFKAAYNNLKNGKAYQKLLDLVEAQHGDINKIDVSEKYFDIKSTYAGYIKSIDALKIGEFARRLGAGRLTKEDSIDPTVGVIVNKKVGDHVKMGDTLMRIYFNQVKAKFNPLELYSFFEIASEKVEKPKLILGIIK